MLFQCSLEVLHVDQARAGLWYLAVQGNSKLQELLKVHSMGEPPFPVSRHVFPDYSSIAAPVALSVEKDRVRLQVVSCWPLLSSCKYHVGYRPKNSPHLCQADKSCYLCPLWQGRVAGCHQAMHTAA